MGQLHFDVLGEVVALLRVKDQPYVHASRAIGDGEVVVLLRVRSDE